MKVSSELIEQLREIAIAAGQEIMEVYSKEISAIEKADASPLTEADLRADACIRRSLEHAFPSLYILSEESRSGDANACDEYIFLVDPLDGTKEFIKRNGEFTVNIALVKHGRPIAGVVHAPALGVTYYAAEGIGAWKMDKAAHATPLVLRPAVPKILRVVASRSHSCDQQRNWLAALACEHRLVEVGSSLKFCLVAEGKADIYPRFQPTSQWDTAAGHCILLTAGGDVRDLAGRPLSYGLKRPILNPSFVASAQINAAVGNSQ